MACATDIYVVNNPQMSQPLVAAALKNPAVKGAEIVLYWNVLEPKAGKFAWRSLDRAIAMTRHKHALSLAIVTGAYSPAWLADAPSSVNFLTFAYGPRGGKTRGCSSISMPVPFAPGYIAAYDAMMDALAIHLTATGAIHAVSIVKTTGIDTTTEENHLPTIGCTDTNPNDPQQTPQQVAAAWQQAGYTSTVLENAWKQMTSEIALDFPNAMVSLDVYASEAVSFPAIGAHGHIAEDGKPPPILRTLITYGVTNFPGRFSTQWNGVSDIGPIPAWLVARLCKVPNAVVGWQSNEFFNTKGAGCGSTEPGGATLCTDTSYLALLNNAKNTCGATMEVWPADVVNHAASFSAFAAE